ncbi:MAG: TIGR03545 family protein [Pirellulales bacterium]
MSRLRRWQSWLPRLMFVAVVLLAVQYGLGIIMRSNVVALGESAIGARVELAHARVSVVGRQIVLGGLRVTDPRQPKTNFVEADRCEFDVVAGPLFHKQVVIERGTATGLRFRIPREASGALPGAKTLEVARSIQWWNNETNQDTQEWLEQLDRRFDPKLINQFESVKRTADLCERVPRETVALCERVQELTKRAELLQAKVNRALVNPLRHAEFLRTVAKEVPALQQEFAQLTNEMDQLPDTIDAERRAIVAARRNDKAWIHDQLQLPPVDANALSAYLLQEQAAEPLGQVLGWLQFVRQIVPAEPVPAVPTGQRGVEVFFAGCDRSPRLLVRELALAGTARIGGRPVELRGTLWDFASTPALHDRPIRVKLSATGSQPLVVQAIIDRTGDVAHDQLLLDTSGVVLPQAVLGESDRLQLALAPSIGALSISVSLDGQQLSGDIQLVQKQVQITPSVGGDLSEVPMTATLGDTLGDVTALATRISLSGTLDEPKCRLWSSLGPAVAEAMDRALDRAAEQHVRRLLVEAQRQVDQQLTDQERQMTESHAELRTHLARVAGQLGELAAQQKPPQRITTEHVGQRLPADSLLR